MNFTNTDVTISMRSEAKEDRVPTIYAIPDKAVDLEKGYYYGVYVLLKFKKMMVLIERRSINRLTHTYMRRRRRTWSLKMKRSINQG